MIKSMFIIFSLLRGVKGQFKETMVVVRWLPEYFSGGQRESVPGSSGRLGPRGKFGPNGFLGGWTLPPYM